MSLLPSIAVIGIGGMFACSTLSGGFLVTIVLRGSVHHGTNKWKWMGLNCADSVERDCGSSSSGSSSSSSSLMSHVSRLTTVEASREILVWLEYFLETENWLQRTYRYHPTSGCGNVR